MDLPAALPGRYATSPVPAALYTSFSAASLTSDTGTTSSFASSLLPYAVRSSPFLAAVAAYAQHARRLTLACACLVLPLVHPYHLPRCWTCRNCRAVVVLFAWTCLCLPLLRNRSLSITPHNHQFRRYASTPFSVTGCLVYTAGCYLAGLRISMDAVLRSLPMYIRIYSSDYAYAAALYPFARTGLAALRAAWPACASTTCALLISPHCCIPVRVLRLISVTRTCVPALLGSRVTRLPTAHMHLAPPAHLHGHLGRLRACDFPRTRPLSPHSLFYAPPTAAVFHYLPPYGT